MKTKSKLSAYILRGSTTTLLFSCVIVALCSASNLPEQPSKAAPSQDNAACDNTETYTNPKDRSHAKSSANARTAPVEPSIKTVVTQRWSGAGRRGSLGKKFP